MFKRKGYEIVDDETLLFSIPKDTSALGFANIENLINHANAGRAREEDKENPPTTLEQLAERINNGPHSPVTDGVIALKLLLSIAVSLENLAIEANAATANMTVGVPKSE